jgi:hypothetical protein
MDNTTLTTIALDEVTSHGDPILRRRFEGDRYTFDGGPCHGNDWEQWGTDQDAWYFGIWVHQPSRTIVQFIEGDLSIVRCADAERFRAEVERMEAHYGAPPIAFIVIDHDGSRTNYISDRLTTTEI